MAYAHNITIDASGVDTLINIGSGYISRHGIETYDLSTGTIYKVFSYPAAMTSAHSGLTKMEP